MATSTDQAMPTASDVGKVVMPNPKDSLEIVMKIAAENIKEQEESEDSQSELIEENHALNIPSSTSPQSSDSNVTSSPSYSCHICHRVFKHHSSMVRHVKGVHQRIRKLACSFEGCDYRTNQKCNLDRHVVRHHQHQTVKKEPKQPPLTPIKNSPFVANMGTMPPHASSPVYTTQLLNQIATSLMKARYSTPSSQPTPLQKSGLPSQIMPNSQTRSTLVQQKQKLPYPQSAYGMSQGYPLTNGMFYSYPYPQNHYVPMAPAPQVSNFSSQPMYGWPSAQPYYVPMGPMPSYPFAYQGTTVASQPNLKPQH